MLANLPSLSFCSEFAAAPGAGMLVVLDPRVTALAQLVRGVQPGAQVLVLDGARPAIAQITHFLAHHTGFTSLHLMGHGRPGAMQLGAGWLDQAALLRQGEAVGAWSAAFGGAEFDLLLYGCHVAQGDRGHAFLRTLQALTQAHLAASQFQIGQTPTLPYWKLETTLGQPRLNLALTTHAQTHYPAHFASYSVSTEAELVTAITNANASTGVADDITITVSTLDIRSALPTITDTAGLTITSSVSGSTIQRIATDITGFRIFDVNGGSLTLNTITVSNGSVTGNGGGISVNTGTLSLTDSTISGNTARDGGGLFNAGGTVTLTSSTVTNNSAVDDGGGILNLGLGNSAANMILDAVTVSNNTASNESGSTLDDGGGGIDNDGNNSALGLGANLTLRNGSTITGNVAVRGFGGGIRVWDGATLSILDSAVTNNTAASAGGLGATGLASPISATTLNQVTNTTITGNVNTSAAADNTRTYQSGVNPGLTANQISGNTVDSNADGDSASSLEDELEITSANPIVQVTVNGVGVSDGGTVDLGSFTQNATTATTFTVTNTGGSDLSLTINTDPDSGDTTRFNVSSFTTSPLAAGASTTFEVTPVTSNTGSLAATAIAFQTNDTTSISSDGRFDFNVTATVTAAATTPVTTPGATSDLAVSNGSQGVFTLGDTGTNGRLQLTVQSSSQSQLETLQVTTSAGDTTLFSILPNTFLPSGFAASDQTFLFDVSGLTTSSTVQFSVNGRPVSTATTELSTGQFSLQFDLDNDGVADDLSLIIDQVATAQLTGAGSNQASGTEVIDLTSNPGPLSATFTVYREAEFNNSVGLYRIDDINGTVNGVAPGSADYAQTALNNRVAGLELTTGNQQSSTATSTLDGGSLYAPFIVVNSSISNFLGGNGGEVFFLYTAANSDNADHIVLLGANTVGFEDLSGGGDLDFNDMIFTMEIS